MAYLKWKKEEALVRLAAHYGVSIPKLEIGLPKGRRKKTLGCYSKRDRKISVFDSNALVDPFVILHEFYHHLRAVRDEKHKGTEKYANKFAKEFVEVYRLCASSNREAAENREILKRLADAL